MPRFRVLQFNMQFGQVWDETNPDTAPVDLERTISEIRGHNADLVFLQEVEQARPGGMQVEPPPNYTRLRAAFHEYDSAFFYPPADARELPFGLGLAVFSCTSLHDSRAVVLPSPNIEFTFHGETKTPTDRLLVATRTEIAGRSVALFNTHLLALFMLGAESESRLEQVDLVASEIAKERGPVILAGDFNVSRHESLVARFAAKGLATVQQRAITWRRRPYVLDHIFHTPDLRLVSHAVVPTAASDHHVVVADFEFTG
jgi:endonuclease/exonuclease/phosphatase family metal-dependent hydrolase